MKKLVAVILLGLVILVVLVMHQTWQKSVTSSGTSVAAYLPEATTLLLMLDSPATSAKKFDLSQHPAFRQMLSTRGQGILGFDITSISAYADNGIDLNKPLGIAFIDFQKSRGLIFIGVNDEKKFNSYLQQHIFKQREMSSQVIASVRCVKVESPFASNIYCFRNGYCLIYGSESAEARKSIDELFVQEILRPSSCLQDNPVFVKAMQGVEGKGDLCFYLNYPQIMQSSLAQVRQRMAGQEALIDKVSSLGQDLSALAFSITAAENQLQVTNYLLFAADSPLAKTYQSSGSCADLLQKFPERPLVCFVNNGNMQEAWKISKQRLNSLLPLLPMTQQFKNIDEILTRLQDSLQQTLSVSVDIEKDLIANVQGGLVFALYDLPGQRRVDVDAIIAARLENPPKIAALLAQLATAANKKYPDLPLQKSVIANAEVFCYDLKTQQQGLAIDPTFGVFGQYLLITSKKQLLEKIVSGEGNWLGKFNKQMVKAAIEKGTPSAGYIRLASMIQQVIALLPPEVSQRITPFTGVVNHFQELTWSSAIKDNGMRSHVVLHADGDLIKQIIGEIDGLIKNK